MSIGDCKRDLANRQGAEEWSLSILSGTSACVTGAVDCHACMSERSRMHV
ncbi:hypothetical protein [Paenibacillus chungangensis]|uniref:Lantibiotic n=1 Tax=Paenibacillus chungangensis TaxID=696535 RepID=A0ABW3HNX9_9BACL